MAGEFQVSGRNSAAPFTLKLHRGDGMVLLGVNWKGAQPPPEFVGFAIEYKQPGGDRFFPLKNRLAFAEAGGKPNPNRLSTRLSPIQKFRWVHFPFDADQAGEFVYRVSPVFMNAQDELSYGETQEAAVELRRETYPGQLNIAYTRGFVSSQAFVDRYAAQGPISDLLPASADAGLTFVPSHPQAAAALTWMGFEARQAILAVLDAAVADPQAQVRVVAYDLNEPDVVGRLEQLGPRLRVIVDDSGDHGAAGAAEAQATARLSAAAGAGNVKRQHMLNLQHNKTIVVTSPTQQTVVCGSTNFSWRGFFVQSNNALVLHGERAVQPFLAAFDAYWANDGAAFGATASARWSDLGLAGIDAQVAFSPHAASNALLATIAGDIRQHTTSSLVFALAFLYQTSGPLRDAITQVFDNDKIFVYGVSDRKVGGLDLQKPDGNVATVFPAQLNKRIPAPFKAEPTGGGGIRLHHKFVVVDFDKPTARVYLGSYNFSAPADTQNGENLLLIRDRRVAVSYAVEAVRIIDHYHFRVAQAEATRGNQAFVLAKPPRLPGEQPWWQDDYTVPHKIRDRELFA